MWCVAASRAWWPGSSFFSVQKYICEDMVCVEVIRRHADEEETIKASCDGYAGAVLHDGDKICTSRAEESIRLIKLKKTSFLDILSNKMLKRD